MQSRVKKLQICKTTQRCITFSIKYILWYRIHRSKKINFLWTLKEHFSTNYTVSKYIMHQSNINNSTIKIKLLRLLKYFIFALLPICVNYFAIIFFFYSVIWYERATYGFQKQRRIIFLKMIRIYLHIYLVKYWQIMISQMIKSHDSTENLYFAINFMQKDI